MANSIYYYNNRMLSYKFSDHHPFNQRRLLLTNDLLMSVGALSSDHMAEPQPIDEDTLLAIHTSEYVNMVKELSQSTPSIEAIEEATRFGLGEGDTPYFPGMHEATISIVAGSVSAAESVMSGEARHALNLGGGLHHAFNHKGAGFCVYNDASIAIAHIRKQYGVKVLYIDTDVHHGDGVQAAFYNDSSVCTYSIHETGKYLFPGTGFAGERGDAEGFGYCFNMPVEPYTEDGSWLDVFEQSIRSVADFFKPDIIVSQHGCDAHYYDPLSHGQCSMEIYLRMPLLIKQLADTYCEGRWVALGGGGYDIWRVVPRAWSLLWLVMTDHPLASRLSSENVPLPEQWLAKYRRKSKAPLPARWLDDKDAWEQVPRRNEITEINKRTMDHALLYL